MSTPAADEKVQLALVALQRARNSVDGARQALASVRGASDEYDSMLGLYDLLEVHMRAIAQLSGLSLDSEPKEDAR